MDDIRRVNPRRRQQRQPRPRQVDSAAPPAKPAPPPAPAEAGTLFDDAELKELDAKFSMPSFGSLPKFDRDKLSAMSATSARHLKGAYQRTVPAGRKLRAKLHRPRPSKKLVVGGGIAGIVGLAVVAGIVFLPKLLPQKPDGTPASAATPSKPRAETLTKGTPDFPTKLPAGKTIEQFGGWTRVSPSDRNPVFAYVDTIDGVPVNVSQQPLPADFRGDTAEQIAILAKGYNATEKLTAGDTTIYLGTSAKGPQSAILAKDNLLILMKSATKLDNASWTTYVDSLK